ncbi:MAG: O-antigen polysaccharide polymerase Wzy family protein [Elusimicrobia bacterium]|nr:O-antigen polysaccharide polymerase Wzy family protein [Elusimicrobiota bacterium]
MASASRRAMPPVLLVHLLFAVLVSSLSAFYFRWNADPSELVIPCAALTLSMSAWWVWSWRKRAGSSFDPYFLFLLAAVAFNCGQIVLEVFGLNRGGILRSMFSDETICESILLITLCLHFLHLGALLAIPSGDALADAGTTPENGVLLDDPALKKVGMALWAFSIIPAFFVLKRSLAVVGSGGYFSLYQQQLDVRLNPAPMLLSLFLVPASLFLLAASKNAPRIRLLAVVSVVGISFVNLVMGQRGAGAMPLIALAFVQHHCIRRFKTPYLLAGGALLALVVFPLLAVVRNQKLADRSDPAMLMQTLTSIENPAVAQISEMGASMVTVSYTLELVPRMRAFERGTSYAFALFTLVPNLFWDIHPTKARRSLEEWLVLMVDPWSAKRGGGLGFSFIAEAYFNFGWLGAPLAMLALGYLLSFMSGRSLRSRDPAKIAALGAFLSFFLMYARGESSGFVRPLIWYAAIPYVMVRWLRRRSKETP